MLALATVHAAVTLYLVGLIWFVQVVHYPLFAMARATFPDYEREHQSRTGRVVALPMLVELATAVPLALGPPESTGPLVPRVGLALVLLIWLSTALVQVPCHRRLSRGWDPSTARRLVRSNWLRTIAWTARAPLALWILTRVAG